MSTRSILVVTLALAFGGCAAILVRQFVLNRNQAPTIETVDVVVASVNIPTQKKLTEELVEIKAWPKSNLHAEIVTAENIDQVLGKVSRFPITAGEAVLTSKVAERNFFDISPGKMMKTISTPDLESANGGMLSPGDRVNVIFVPSDPKTNEPETVLYNERILAVDNKTIQPETDGDPEFSRIQSISLEVTEDQAKLLAHLQKTGSLSLTLLPGESQEDERPDKTLADFVPANEPAPKELSDAIVEQATHVEALQGIPVLVANRPIYAGETIERASFEVVMKPEDAILEGTLLAHESDKIVGSQALVSLVRGEMLIAQRFSRKGSISDQVTPGMRAKKVISTTGEILPVAPEDHVEVYFTPNQIYSTNNDQTNNQPPPTVALMTGVRVIAVNDQIVREVNDTTGVQSLVLEVTPNEANMLSYAEKNGTIETVLIPQVDEAPRNGMSLEELQNLISPPPEPEVVVEPSPPTPLPVVVEPARIEPPIQTVAIRELRNRVLGETTFQVFPSSNR